MVYEDGFDDWEYSWSGSGIACGGVPDCAESPRAGWRRRPSAPTIESGRRAASDAGELAPGSAREEPGAGRATRSNRRRETAADAGARPRAADAEAPIWQWPINTRQSRPTRTCTCSWSARSCQDAASATLRAAVAEKDVALADADVTIRSSADRQRDQAGVYARSSSRGSRLKSIWRASTCCARSPTWPRRSTHPAASRSRTC